MVELERKGGYVLVIALSLTAMIGTGMFFGPAIAASYAGPASILAWIILGLITIYVGFLFAELSSLFPETGGVYAFAKHAYGRFASFIIAWVTWLVGSITPAVILVAALDYLENIIPIVGPYKVFIAIGLVLVLNFVAYRGIQASTAILVFFAVVTVSVIGVILFAGASHFDGANFSPFFVTSPLLVLVAVFFILETFFGWESATFMGGEVKNPSKVIPRSIVITTIIVVVLGCAFAAVMLGVVPWQQLVQFKTPLFDVSLLLFGSTAARVVNIAIFLALVGSAAGTIVSSPRLILALAKDKLFIEQLSAVHPKFKTPHKAIMFQTVISVLVIFIAFGSYQALLSLLVPLALIMYLSVVVAVPVLRKKFPHQHRNVKAPFLRFGVFVVVLFYLSVLVFWLVHEPYAWTLFVKIISFILFGVPIFLLLTLYYDPDALLKAVNFFAYISRVFEDVTLPSSVRKEILGIFGDMRGKRVLEYGSGVGTLTVPLARAVGESGHVYTTDLSLNNIKILRKRLVKSRLGHITAIHDPHQISRVHPDVPRIDMIYSVGNLSYVQDLRSVLREMSELLPENGKVCFVEYVDYFWGAIPNQAWLDDVQALELAFKQAGFSVRIRKRRAGVWNYLYVYGIKSEYDVPVI